MRSNDIRQLGEPIMADTKPVKMQKRRAMGENVTGMKKGGAVRMPKDKGKSTKSKDC